MKLLNAKKMILRHLKEEAASKAVRQSFTSNWEGIIEGWQDAPK